MYAVQTAAMPRSRSFGVHWMATCDMGSAEKVPQPKEAKTSLARDDRHPSFTMLPNS
jgi:hypothetical protein